jgi:hypothetical protein
MQNNLIKDIQFINLMGATTGTAAATTEAPGVVDMSGYTGCLFIAMSATTGFEAATDIFIKEAATTSATFLSLEAGGAVAASVAATRTERSALIIDVYKPRDRYLMVGMTSGTIGDIAAVYAIQYGARTGPVAPTTADPTYNPVLPADVTVVATPSTAA